MHSPSPLVRNFGFRADYRLLVSDQVLVHSGLEVEATIKLVPHFRSSTCRLGCASGRH
jgi:hypothetical protein